MKERGKQRVIIENVRPMVECGRFPIKRIIGESIHVTADIFTDGHDALRAVLLYRKKDETTWTENPMAFDVNDRWKGVFHVTELGFYHYSIEAWVDHFLTWQHDVKKKFAAGQDVGVDLRIGLEHIKTALNRSGDADRKQLRDLLRSVDNCKGMEERVALVLAQPVDYILKKYADRTHAARYGRELEVIVERQKALFSAWYERFPRSCSSVPGQHGTFRDCEAILPEVARMGFDVFYLPPVHPIGKTLRKGRNNNPVSEPDDVGSPWAIGSEEGGHTAIHPLLGTMDDFRNLVRRARDHGLEVAMDIAFQCSPDHPYVREHPTWFKWRPDKTIQYAENPPKKYEDIYPLNFETDDWEDLWEELKRVFLFWIENDVRIFRVDNPHTKSFHFWEWLIREVQNQYPEVIFLSEAFTRPKVMYRLAKLGFSQSYTYFAWRNTKKEFIDYLTELTRTEIRDFFRPNFWPNTPDILPEHLQFGGRPAFKARLILSAMMSSSYGIYGPPFELCVSTAAEGKEEYLDSEKYELKQWEWDAEGNLKELIARVNRIRKDNPSLQTTWNLNFLDVENDYLLFFSKTTDDLSNIILVVVNLDPYHSQSGWVHVPVRDLGIDPGHPYLVHDLLSDDKFIWHGERNYVEINPHVMPAHIFRVRKRLKSEHDFDYFM